LLCTNFATFGHDPITLIAGLFYRCHGRILIELRAVTRGGVRQTDGEFAHVHLAAMTLQQAAEKAVRLNFGRDPIAADDLDIGVNFTPDHLRRLLQMREMMRLGGKLQLARCKVIAIDLLFADQAFDGIDCSRIRPITTARLLHAKLLNQRGKILRDAGIDLTAVAPRRTAADSPRVQHRHRRAAFAQRQRGRQAREARSDHSHVDLTVDRAIAR
jgi:hypothetical protein